MHPDFFHSRMSDGACEMRASDRVEICTLDKRFEIPRFARTWQLPVLRKADVAAAGNVAMLNHRLKIPSECQT